MSRGGEEEEEEGRGVVRHYYIIPPNLSGHENVSTKPFGHTNLFLCHG